MTVSQIDLYSPTNARSFRGHGEIARWPALPARHKSFVGLEGVTLAVQDGNTPKHLHANANEIQYVLEGTGTIWLGDKEVRVKPGDLIIPKGTPHGGTKPDGRTIKAIAIKSPPQAPDDVKLLN